MSRFFPIISIGLLILLIVGGYFFWWPKYQEFQDKKLELQTKEREVKEKEEYFSGLKTLSEKVASYSDQLSKIDAALPTAPSIAVLFNFIQKASSENGLILTDTDMGGLYSLEATEERIQKMPFSVSLSGSYSAFKNFLSTIYKNARVIEVNSIGFSSPGEEELFSFSLLLETQAYQKAKTERE